MRGSRTRRMAKLFPVLDPAEIKGGSLLFDGRQWLRDVRGEHRLLNKDPFAQTQRGMYDDVELVKTSMAVPATTCPSPTDSPWRSRTAGSTAKCRRASSAS